MKKHLLFTFLTVCMGLGTVSAQLTNDPVTNKENHSDIETAQWHDHEATALLPLEVRTNKSKASGLAMSLHSILSSDNGFDFNCHGGFCMQKKHSHKKGLSQNKQLFSYFMKVSG